MNRAPSFNKWLARTGWALVGILFFLWIGVEDRGLGAVLALSGLIAASTWMSVLVRWTGREGMSARGWLMRAGLAGLLAGALVGPVAALLISLKTSLHTHPVPDFQASDLALVFQGTILRAGAGAAFGIGLGALLLAWGRPEA